MYGTSLTSDILTSIYRAYGDPKSSRPTSASNAYGMRRDGSHPAGRIPNLGTPMFLRAGGFFEVRGHSAHFSHVLMAFPRTSEVSTSAGPSDNISICHNHIFILLNVLSASLQLHLSRLFFDSRGYHGG